MEKQERREKPAIRVGELVKVEKIGPEYEPGSEIFVGRIGQVTRMKWGRVYVEFVDDMMAEFKIEDLSPV